MNSMNLFLSLKDMSDGLTDNTTSRSIDELNTICKYVSSRVKSNLLVRSMRSIVKFINLSIDYSLVLYKFTNYKGDVKCKWMVYNNYGQ